MLEVIDFTRSADPLFEHLKKKFPEGIYISDITNTLGKQYVDLVQEGGGVHGIALAGYTYVLEKMGISFMKMAGTSAGSINTLLLNAVYTKEEASLLGEKEENYFETRSEKVLDYLSKQDLKDFVDGHQLWRKLILGVFSPTVKKTGVKGVWKQFKSLLFTAGICIFLLIVCGVFLAHSYGTLHMVISWLLYLVLVTFLIVTTVIVLRILYGKKLYKLIEKFGINPGENFEKWIVKILEENGIHTIFDLNKKFEREKEKLDPRYQACGHKNLLEREDLQLYKPLISRISDPTVNTDLLYEDLCAVYYVQEAWDKEKTSIFWQHVIRAFEIRLEQDRVVTKEMVIVSSDITHGLKVEFPGMHKMYWGKDYSISPARYVRASMSVPFFFRPMEIEFNQTQEKKKEIREAWEEVLKVENKLEKKALFVDGGLLSNFPINVFYNSAMPVPRKPTLGIKLEYENNIDSRAIDSFLDYGGSIVNTMRYFYDRDFALKQDIYKKTVRSIDTGKVHWLNFNLTDQEKMELFFRGALAATIFLSKHSSSDSEINALTLLGEKVPVKSSFFSIYSKEHPDFRLEDLLIKSIDFEWQQYKIERLLDRLSKQERKDHLKSGAALQDVKK